MPTCPPPADMSLFCCENVTKRYQGGEVIRGISLALDQGELVSLLGHSGVGKTTLMGVLAGVDSPDTGRVLLGGREITGAPGQVGYMLQKDLLLPHKTAQDNICLPLVLRGVPKKEAREQARELMARFGLGESGEKYPYQLSGGMRQRAALLRTYLTGHKVVLLDEPFSALDAMTKGELHRWYLEVMGEMGLTTLFITHDVDEALTLSDRIYLMAGTPGEIALEHRVSQPRPRAPQWNVSPAFAAEKQLLLARLTSPPG